MENSRTMKRKENASCNISMEGHTEGKMLTEETFMEVVEEYDSEADDYDPMIKDGSVKAGDKRWVVKMKGNLRHTIHGRSDYRWGHFIFRIPQWIKNRTNREAYEPWLVSLGPHHHGRRRPIMVMEENKHHAVQAVVERMNRGDALNQLASAVDELEAFLCQAYYGLENPWRMGEDIDRFKEMMLVDGCFLLELIRVYELLKEDKECDSYPEDDPVFSKRGFGYLYLSLKSDLTVMENQIPLLLLKKLHEKINGKIVVNKIINNMVLNFLGCTYRGSNDRLGLHPLHILHLSFCGEQVPNEELWCDLDDTTTRSVTELAEAGICFKKCSTCSVNAIDFRNGVLTMPEIKVNDRTEGDFLNLMAFERLYGGVGSNATAFVIFMDSIIDSEKDVALLRSEGIIKNMLSSDKEAARLFNTLGKGAILSNPSNHLYNVRQELNKHCKNKWNMWGANFLQTYMRNPWVFSAFVASVFLLISTFLQTIYTVMSFYKR